MIGAIKKLRCPSCSSGVDEGRARWTQAEINRYQKGGCLQALCSNAALGVLQMSMHAVSIEPISF